MNENNLEKLKSVFRNGRDATGCSDEYLRGMYNGIEWCLACIEDREPEYKEACERGVVDCTLLGQELDIQCNMAKEMKP